MGLNSIASTLSKKNDLSMLLENPEELHVGYIIKMDFESVDILTNDFMKERVGGLPQNSFLLASAINTKAPEKTQKVDEVLLLLRVQGPVKLPQDDSNLTTIIEHFQSRETIHKVDDRDGIEPITHSLLQFGGLRCATIGSFYLDTNGSLQLGSDIEDFQSIAHMRVFKPSPTALETIVNFIDPIRKSKAKKESAELGFSKMPEPFEIGKVRFTSTNRLQHMTGDSGVPVRIQPTDFLSRRTGVLGMTRTGKSNTVKTTISSVALAAAREGIKIGQLVFDMNGEYANANGQDDGSSIAEVFDENVIRYRGLLTDGFRDLRDNFYKSLDNGLALLKSSLAEMSGKNTGQDLQALLQLDLEQPDISDISGNKRWKRTVAIYKALLKSSGFEPDESDDYLIFEFPKHIQLQVFDALYEEEDDSPSSNQASKASYVIQKIGFNPNARMTLDQAVDFFTILRKAEKKLRDENRRAYGLESSTRGKGWLSQSDAGLLNLIVGLSDNDTRIRSGKFIYNAGRDFHSKKGSDNIANDIYAELVKGKIVILDLSVGVQSVRENISTKIAHNVFLNSFNKFTSGDTPSSIVIYVEEAHNLIGNKADFNTTWPRIAKEGAKAKLALVYATQEPSSIHPNILANTENFFVTHLNNDDELRSLAKYYDFSDFTRSLKRSQDVGFARIKTLSSPFVIPTQILLFEPKRLKEQYKRACETK